MKIKKEHILIGAVILILGTFLYMGSLGYDPYACYDVDEWGKKTPYKNGEYFVERGFIKLCDKGKWYRWTTETSQMGCAYCDSLSCGYWNTKDNTVTNYQLGDKANIMDRPYISSGDSEVDSTYYITEKFTVYKPDGTSIILNTVKEASKKIIPTGTSLRQNLQKLGLTSWWEGVFLSTGDVICSNGKEYTCSSSIIGWDSTGNTCSTSNGGVTTTIPPVVTTTTIPPILPLFEDDITILLLAIMGLFLIYLLLWGYGK